MRVSTLTGRISDGLEGFLHPAHFEVGGMMVVGIDLEEGVLGQLGHSPGVIFFDRGSFLVPRSQVFEHLGGLFCFSLEGIVSIVTPEGVTERVGIGLLLLKCESAGCVG